MHSLVDTLIHKTSYQLQTLRPSLHSWLQLPNAAYFTPNGEVLLAILAIEELPCSNRRPVANGPQDGHGLSDLEALEIAVVVQLRDCLVDLLEAEKVEEGLCQGVYLLEKMRRLVCDAEMDFSVQGMSFICSRFD
jgi:hypothetical protein